jgi:YD repeat-containing protein
MTFTDMSGTMHNLGTGALATASTASWGTTIFACQGVFATLPPNGDGQVIGTLYSGTAVNDLAGNSPSSGAFAVTDKSGTVYLFSGGMASQSSPNGNFYPVLIEDRNGNQIGMSNSGGGNYLDTRGQIVQLPNGNNSDSPFTVDNITYTPSWSTISVNYQIQASGGASPGLGVGCQAFPTTVSGTRSALSLLALPNGQEYQFAYNSYGLLSEIIYPDGGWVKYTWQMPTGFNEMTSMPGTVVVSAVAGEPVVYGQSPFGCVWQYQTPVLAKRQVSFDGTTVAQTQSLG